MKIKYKDIKNLDYNKMNIKNFARWKHDILITCPKNKVATWKSYFNFIESEHTKDRLFWVVPIFGFAVVVISIIIMINMR